MAEANAQTTIPLSRKGALAYSAGLLAAGIFFSFNTFTLPLYLSLYTSNAILIGWLSSTRSFEQAIVQPIIGAWSDRTWVPRLGRRTPFFLTAMPIAAVLMLVNGLLPHDPAFLWIVVAVVFAFSFLFNIGIDPYYALLADLTTPEQRSSVNGIAQAFGFLGQLVAPIAAFFLWSIHPAWIFAVVGVGLLIGFGIVALGVRERGGRMETPAKRHVSTRRSVMEFLVYLRHLFTEQPQPMKLLGVKFLYQFGINAAAPFITLFVVSEIGLQGWPEVVRAIPFGARFGLDQASPEAVSQFVGFFFLFVMLLTAIPCGYLGDRFGKRRVFGLGLLVLGIAAFFAASAQTLPQLLLYVVFIGIGNAAQTVLFFPYLTELVPSSRVGEFTGLSAFAETSGVVFSVLLAGELINLNPYGLHYRLVFMVTGLFILLAFGALLLIRRKHPYVRPAASHMPAMESKEQQPKGAGASQRDHITPTRLDARPPWWYHLFRLFVWVVARLLFRVRVAGTANIPRGNYIVIANHLSWVDPFLLMMVLPANPRLYFIGPLQAVNRGWKGWMVRTFDVMIAFERGANWIGKDMLKTSLLVLEKGAVLGLFPEGHLGPQEGELEPLQRGIGHLVLKANRPVLPIALSGVQELYLRKPVTITVGKPFRIATQGIDRHADVDAAVEQIARELRAVIPPYVEHKPRLKVWRGLSYLLDRTPPQSS